MNTNRQQNGMTPLQGNLLRLPGRREIAIYLRDGAAWVADFNNGHAELHTASGWYDTGNGRMLAHAQRRGEVEIVSPIPEGVAERIEGLHRSGANPGASPAAWLARLAAGLGNRFAKVPNGFSVR
jgi:hypothetical protein